MNPLFLAALSLLLAQSSTPPSHSPQPDSSPTIRVGTEEVVLDVIARDKKGHTVPNLKPEDLHVFDNGVSRKITSFQLIQGNESIKSDFSRGPAATAPAPVSKPLNPLQQVRLVTLIFNRLDIDARQLARKAALDMLQQDYPQNVYFSVWVLGENLEAIQPFTRKREILLKAVERATSGAYSEFVSDSAQIEQELQQMLGPNTSGGSNGEQLGDLGVGGGGSGAAGAVDAGASANAAMAQMMYNTLILTRHAELAQTGRAAIWGLISAVEQQYRLPGRKSVLLFSSGFGVPQGMEEAFKTLISTANRFNVTFYSIDARGLNTKSANQEAVSQLRDASAASRAQFRKNGGQVTPAMANALDMAIDAGRNNNQDTLADLAESTGGFLIANTNDFRAPLRRLTEDIETYYEVTYNPGIEKYDGSFRKVELKSDRAGVHLQSRAGYFALPTGVAGGAPVLSPYEVPLLKALDTKPAPKAFRFQSTGLHYRGSGTDPTCDLVIDVPLSNMKLQQDKEKAVYQGDFAYLTLVKNATGEIVRKFRDDVPLSSSSLQIDAFRASHFIYTEHFPLPPGRYTLETAVLDRQTGEASVRKSVFFMPALNGTLGLSSIAVVRDLREKGQSTSDQDPLLMSGKLVSPGLNPVIKRNDSSGASFYVVVYPDPHQASKPKLRMTFNRDGQALGSVSPELGEPDSKGRIQYVATAPIDELQPGEYQVLFSVRQADEGAEESVTFSIE